MNSNDATSSENARTPAEGGYGSPTPEDEMPEGADTNPGSPDPTLQGQDSDAQSLTNDKSIGVPEKNFFDNEDASSDGEPGAGRLGGTDEQFRDELATVDADADASDDAL